MDTITQPLGIPSKETLQCAIAELRLLAKVQDGICIEQSDADAMATRLTAISSELEKIILRPYTKFPLQQKEDHSLPTG